MGKPGVLLSLASQYGANTLTTTLAVEQALASLRPALEAQGITLYSGLQRPANFIERALGDLKQSLVIAGGADSRGAVRVPARLPRGADRLHRHSAVAARGDRRARPHGPHAQHDDAGRLRRRPGRAGRRCHHRHREHPAAAARERAAAQPLAAARRDPRGLARRCAAR